jgi:hypothetical protein
MWLLVIELLREARPCNRRTFGQNQEADMEMSLQALSSLIVSILGGIAGASGVVVGLIGFLESKSIARDQAVFQKELANLNASIDKDMEIFRAQNELFKFYRQKQFEKEFDVYVVVWGRLKELLDALSFLFDEYRDLGVPNSPGRDLYRESRDAVSESIHSVLEVMLRSSPFIHREVEILIDDFLSLSGTTLVDDQYSSLASLTPNSRKIGLDGFKERLQNIRNAIRWRIGLADSMEDDGRTTKYI